MDTIRCPGCGAFIETDETTVRCPECGALIDAPGPFASASGSHAGEIIDVTARGADGAPLTHEAEETPVGARPVYEERTFSGRAWPGGPFMQGRTIIFRSGGPIQGDGRGCCGCGCLVAALFAILCFRGLMTFFQ